MGWIVAEMEWMVMGKVQSLKRTAGGLVTNPNALNEVPEGALLEAENCIMDRPGVIGKRRGFKKFGTAISPAAFTEFTGRLLAQEGTALSRDPDGLGNWAAYTGTFSPPDSAARMRGLEIQSTLYVTTSTGVKRTDTLSAAPIQTGIPTGLDLKLTLIGAGAGWFNPETQVGYRILWGRVDATGRLLLGAPSMREALTNVKSATLNYTVAANTITVTHVAHGFANGDIIEISDVSQAGAENGPHAITSTGVDTYTYTVAVGPINGTLKDAKKFDVNLNFAVPDDIGEGDFYDIYRTELSASATADPGDRQKRVIRHDLTATAVTFAYAVGVVTVTHAAHGFASNDVVRIIDPSNSLFEAGRHLITSTGANTYTYTVSGAPPANGSGKSLLMHVAITDDWDLSLGEDLYTNIQQEGILQANARPPWAKDIAHWKGFMHYLNAKKEHFLPLQLLDVTGLVDNTSAITITQGATALTYTFSSAESLSLRRFQRFTAEPTLAQNIEKTMKSFSKILNRDPGSLWYAWYISGILDLPGQIVIETRTLNTAQFTMTVNNVTTSSKLSPSPPTTGTTLKSDNQIAVNRLYYSKLEQPEAVPDLNSDPIGDDSKDGLRILPSRDALFIVTEAGLYVKAGETQRDFAIRLLDPSIHGRAPETWRVLDNAIYGLSTNGIVRATEAGTTLVSWSIDDKIALILATPNHQTLCHATAYESESKYILWAPEKMTDTVANVAWVYNTLTKKWTGPWRKTVKAAHVLFDDDILCLSHNEDVAFPAILKERKSLLDDLTDYMDEEIDVTSSAVATTTDDDGNTVSLVTITGWTYTKSPQEGWLYRKDPSSLPNSKITRVDEPVPGTFIFRLEDHFPGLTTGTGTVTVAIVQRVRWAPESGGNAGALKHYPATSIYFEKGTALRNKISYFSDMNTVEAGGGETRISKTTGGVLLRDIIPTQFQRCRALSLIYESRYAKEHADILHVTYSLRVTGERAMGRSR